MLYGINVRYRCMQVLTYIQVLFNATTTTKYAILDLLLLNADTDVSTDCISAGDYGTCILCGHETIGRS